MATPAFNIPGTTALDAADFQRRFTKDLPERDLDALGGYGVLDALRRSADYADATAEKPLSPAPKLRVVPTVAEEVAAFNYCNDAANLVYAWFKLPEHLHYFCNVISALMGNRTDFTHIDDEEIAGRMGVSTRTVARRRNELDDWQQKENITLIGILDHYTDKQGNRHPHRYKVLISEIAVSIKRAAQSRSDWSRDPGAAMERAMREFIDSVPTIPSKRKRKRRTPDLRDQINTNLKRAGNATAKAIRDIAALQMQGFARDFEPNPELVQNLSHNLSVLKGEVSAEPILSSTSSSLVVDKVVENQTDDLVDISSSQIVHKNKINNLQPVDGGFDRFPDTLEAGGEGDDSDPFGFNEGFGF